MIRLPESPLLGILAALVAGWQVRWLGLCATGHTQPCKTLSTVRKGTKRSVPNVATVTKIQEQLRFAASRCTDSNYISFLFLLFYLLPFYQTLFLSFSSPRVCSRYGYAMYQ